MADYKRLLVAVDLTVESDELVLSRAYDLAKRYNADLTMVHAIEYLSNYGAAYGVAIATDIEYSLKENAENTMKKLGKKFDIPESHQIVKIGPAKSIILDEATDRKIDLIVMGSHGRHGLRLLLGSTANAVLHGAKCDVLAIRVKD